MKASDLMKAVRRHILPLLPGFKYKPTTILYATPAELVLRAFYFQTSYLDRDAFTVWAFAQPLYVPYDHLVLNIGGRLGWLHKGKDIWWRWRPNDAELEKQVMHEIYWYIQKYGLPFLDRVRTPSDVIWWIDKKSGNPKDVHYQEAKAYSYILTGNCDRAQRILPRLYTELRQDEPNYPWMGEMAERVSLIQSLLEQSPEAAIQQLHEWRKWTLTKLRLEKEI